MRSLEHAHPMPALSCRGHGGAAKEVKKDYRRHRLRHPYFLKSLSNASRASLALRGGGVLIPCAGPLAPLLPCVDEASRATVTRGENVTQSFC